MEKMPTEKDFSEVIDKQADVLESQLLESAPIGTYSKERINALVDALNKATDVIAAVAKQTIPPAQKVSADIEKEKLPLDILLRSSAIYSLAKEFEKATGIEFGIPPVAQLVDDGAIALASVNIKKLIADRDFKKFLSEPTGMKSQMKQEDEMGEPTSEQKPNLTPEQEEEYKQFFN